MADVPEIPVAGTVEPSGKLKDTGLDRTAQIAVEAMSDAHDAKDWATCVKVGDAWIEARGEMPALCCVWYAQSLLGVGRVEEAMLWAKVAAENIPDEEKLGKMAAKGCYAQILAAQGHFAKARRLFKDLIRVEQEHPEAVEKLAHITLAVSDKWAKGWAMHEARLRNEKRPFPENCRPWDGVTKEPVAVLHEQGIGDAILTARWLPWLAKQTGHPVTWYGPNLIHRWVEGMGAVVGNIDDAQTQAEPMAAVYSLSLPHYAGVALPRHVPAPVAPEALADLRAQRAPNRAVRVGVCWRGADWNYHNFERSYTPEQFAPVVQPIDGVEFVNFCHAADVPDGWPFGQVEFSDVYDTGEHLSSMDLVVSVDTAVVHLAGSLGIPTLALLPTKLDWRYAWPFGSTTPFYPSVMTLRRKTSTDLGAVTAARVMLERYAHALTVQKARAA